MGSGCSSNKYLSSCVDTTSSDCVKWVGDEVEVLGICTGDNLTEVVEVILSKLQDIAQAKGIKLNDLVASCADLDLLIQNSDKELSSILKIILDRECYLQSQITQINTIINTTTPITVDLKCLPNTVTNRAQLDQALIDKLCAFQDRLDILEGKIPQQVNITELVTDVLFDKLKSCNGGIEVSGTGVNRSFNFTGMIPVGGRIFTEVSLTNFTNTGLGTGVWCNFALCNGLNGTRNMAGLVPAMANNVQGALAPGQFGTINVGDVRGADAITLTSGQLPNHSHTVTQTPHSHTVVSYGNSVFYDSASGNNNGDFMKHSPNSSPTLTTSSSLANITVSGMQGASGQPINIIQPTLYGVWIQRIS